MIFVCAMHKIFLAPGNYAANTQVAGYFCNGHGDISAGAVCIRQVVVKGLTDWHELPCDCLDVFKHVKIARWHHFNADNFETLKANYVLIRLFVFIKDDYIFR